MSYNTALSRLKAIAAETGIADAWHPHNLRHQYASEEADGGANIPDLSETLGHRSPEITYSRYVRSMPGRLERTAARMNGRWAAAPRQGSAPAARRLAAVA